MTTRMLSALFMTPLLLFVYWGGLPLALACMLISAIAVRELIRAFHAGGARPSWVLCYVFLFFLYGFYFASPLNHKLMALWITSAFICSSAYMFRDFQNRQLIDSLATFVTIMYAEFLPFHIVATDSTGPYRRLIWMIFLTAMVNDTFAYFTGRLVGKTKLCPHLSPHKTVEGAVGGVLGTLLMSFLFGFFFARSVLLHCLLIGFFGALLSIAGDLTASAYKREMGIKDFGHLIPGHGGLMDRFDSVFFAAPGIYYYIVLFLMR